MKKSKLPGESLADYAYIVLRDQIVLLEIAPGAPLNDSFLGEMLNVGRTPVREALKRLEIDNLVVTHPRRGTFASVVDIADLANISDIRQRLEPLAAKRAAEVKYSSGINKLTVLREKLKNIDIDTIARNDMLRIDMQIHRAIYEATNNKFLSETASRLDSLATRIWCMVSDKLPPFVTDVKEHIDLMESVIMGDSYRAEDLATRHVNNFEIKIREMI